MGDKNAYPTLQKHINTLKPGGTFCEVKLVKGWLITKDKGQEAGKSRFTWSARSDSEIKKQREKLAHFHFNTFQYYKNIFVVLPLPAHSNTCTVLLVPRYFKILFLKLKLWHF